VFGIDLELFLAGLANPEMFAVNESVVVDALAVVVGAQIALHHEVDSIRFYLGSSFCAASPRMTTSTRRLVERPSAVSLDVTGRYSP
jgi:hypothetical protein